MAGVSTLVGSVEPGKVWIRGNIYTANSSSPTLSPGQMMAGYRAPALVNATGHYFTVTPPTYEEFDVSQVVNVKDVSDYPVVGDGVTDDTLSLQAILNTSTGKILYFPHGIYIIKDTLLVPPGSRLVGESWSQFSASGEKFSDPKKPTPMIRFGNPGDVGVAQITDFVLTVDDILPGAVLLEVNMAAARPGDVGIFNTHFDISGMAGSKVQTNPACWNSPLTCNAARLCAHFTPSASVYVENSWAWAADHDVDFGTGGQPSSGGGFLVESTNGTWILGVGSGKSSLLFHFLSLLLNTWLI
jgi:glucan 1,3-beta-glucosidase